MGEIYLYNHGGSANHGCEALARTVSSIIEKNKKKIVLSEMPQEDFKYNLQEVLEIGSAVQTYSKFSGAFGKAYLELKKSGNYFLMDILPYRKSIKDIKKEDKVISIGGDIYCYEDYPKFIYLHELICKQNCKTALIGCSLNESLFKDKRFIEDMKKYTYISARESLTYELLKKAGLKNIGLTPDSAFILPVEQVTLPKGFIDKNTIGINVSPLVENREKKKGIVYSNFKNLIQNILDTTDCAVALIPHVVWESNDDRTILKKLYNEFKDNERVIMIEDCNCMQLKGYISRCRFFIGARTHATIAAYSTFVPTLVLGYSIKSRGIATDLFGSDENYVISIQDLLNEEDLYQAFLWILKNEEKIKEILKDRIPEVIADVNKLGKVIDMKLGD